MFVLCYKLWFIINVCVVNILCELHYLVPTSYFMRLLESKYYYVFYTDNEVKNLRPGISTADSAINFACSR
ncbi:hypothetical protein PVAP13_3NG042690 [Panicum virgatum]|uniref:Uncharacterized protein n=1 Tax=Panicum virgatum TaxID=38727 RepID=A0A8T0TUP4_PANVG|nr:hypothetical protein PVAP13_3NG042690 [Panicum virgatum]